MYVSFIMSLPTKSCLDILVVLVDQVNAEVL